jgi:selenocysteine-specific elongation factor
MKTGGMASPRPPDKQHIIIGTAGHVDHGKSALVKALTGTDPDSLPEEKARGLTIELGFVFLDIPGYEKQIVFIDVPGHERLVKTMVAGASHINAALLVIAADEGVAVQTREHFDILTLLGIERGLIALTKADLVDSSRLEEVRREVRNFVRGTILEGAPVIPVSAMTGDGLDELKSALLDIGRQVEPAEDSGIFRLPIDRVFSIHGFGTVIAGTVLSGKVKTGDKIEIFPDGIIAKVRGIQVHKEKSEASGIGRRTALNLQDIDKDLLRRGQCAAKPGALSPSLRMDARLRLLPAAKEIRTRDRLRVHLGTDEIIARIVLLEQERLLPGESALVQLVLESPGVAFPGDRFIVRTFSPVLTIGGGEILDPIAERHKRHDAGAIAGIKRFEGTLDDRVEQVFRKTPQRTKPPEEAAVLLGKRVSLIREAVGRLADSGKLVRISDEKEERFLPAEAWPALRKRALAVLEKHLLENPHRSSMPVADLKSQLGRQADEISIRAVIEELVSRKSLLPVDSGLALPGHQAKLGQRDKELAGHLETVYRKAGFEPPLEEEVVKQMRLPLNEFRKILGTLLKEGRLVRLDARIIYHREALERATALLADFLRQRREIRIADVKDVLRVSRKFACAVLEHLDKIHVTSRRGDVHVLK